MEGNLRDFGALLVRLGMGGIFLVLGIDQLVRPDAWLGYLPGWSSSLPLPGPALILLNGSLDLALGLLLLLGLLTRLAGALGALHVLGIALTLGYNDVAVRDVGLALACLGVAFMGAPRWSLDRMIESRAPAWLRRLMG